MSYVKQTSRAFMSAKVVKVCADKKYVIILNEGVTYKMEPSRYVFFVSFRLGSRDYGYAKNGLCYNLSHVLEGDICSVTFTEWNKKISDATTIVKRFIRLLAINRDPNLTHLDMIARMEEQNGNTTKNVVSTTTETK